MSDLQYKTQAAGRQAFPTEKIKKLCFSQPLVGFNPVREQQFLVLGGLVGIEQKAINTGQNA
jgi:hypothetical protein